MYKKETQKYADTRTLAEKGGFTPYPLPPIPYPFYLYNIGDIIGDNLYNKGKTTNELQLVR